MCTIVFPGTVSVSLGMWQLVQWRHSTCRWCQQSLTVGWAVVLIVFLPHPWCRSFFTLCAKPQANGINMRKHNFVSAIVTLGCTTEHTHPLVGCLRRAIDSSKKSQIKTHLQTGKRNPAPPQSNVKRLATWKQKLSKELREAQTKFMRKK